MWHCSNDMIIDIGPKEVCSFLSTLFAFLDQRVVKDDSITIQEDNDEGIPILCGGQLATPQHWSESSSPS